MKTLYSGYYGAMNSGDDAFVEVSSWGAKKYWNCDEHLFFASQLPETHIDVSFYNAHKNYFNFSKAVYDIFQSDVFISAGGSTFHSSLKMTDLRYYAKIKKKFNFKGETGAIGISLGPYTSSKAEKSTIEYLKTLDFLALRDTRSYEIAKSYDLPYSSIKAFDLAALLPSIYNLNKNLNNQNIIGISICNYESYTNGDLNNEKKRNDFVANVLKIVSKNKEIVFRFFVFNGNPKIGDENLTLKIINELEKKTDFKYEIIPYLANVEKIYNKIAECNLIISTRLHASIFACYANVPFLLLEYHIKCTDFLNDIGQNQEYRIYDGDLSPIEVSNIIMNILLDNSYIIPTNIEETRQRSLLNFTATYNKNSSMGF